MQKWLKLCVIGLIAVATVTGCRTSRRGARVGGDAAELKVFLNFPPHDFDAATFSYELSGCEGIPALSGAPASDLTYVTFKAVGLKQGMLCQLRVKDLAADSNILTFTGEPNVLFWADKVPLTQDADGHLKADPVSLVPLYQIKPQPGTDSFKVKVPVTFNAAHKGDLKAFLICEPELLNPSLSNTVNDKKGDFLFGFMLTKAKEHTCSAMTVRGDQSFDGVFAKPFVFTPEKNVTISSPQTVALKLVESKPPPPTPPPPPPGDEVTVDTEASADDCTEDFYFDIEAGECKKK